MARCTKAAVDHWLPSTYKAESAVLAGRIYRIELFSNVINVNNTSAKMKCLTWICVAVPLAIGLVKTAYD